jgi:hypothetical protein
MLDGIPEAGSIAQAGLVITQHPVNLTLHPQ